MSLRGWTSGVLAIAMLAGCGRLGYDAVADALDVFTFRLTDSSQSVSSPAIAEIDGGYAIAWEVGDIGTRHVQLAIVGADGSVIAPEQSIAGDLGDASSPSLAWVNGRLGVAWLDDRAVPTQVYFASFDGTGARQSDDLRMSVDPREIRAPALAAAGDSFALIQAEELAGNGSVTLTLLGTDGVDLSGPIPLADSQGREAHRANIAVSETGMLAIAWAEESERGVPGRLWFRSVAGDARSMEDPTSLESAVGHGPTIACVDDRYVAVSETDTAGLALWWMNQSGSTQTEIALADAASQPALVGSDGELMLSWVSSSGVQLGTLGQSGEWISDPLSLRELPPNFAAKGTAMAGGGDSLAVTWVEGDVERDVYVSVVRGLGR